MMLRHIISVGLAMTACASLVLTKANAATFTLEPIGSLQRNPGDLIEFVLKVDPNSNPPSGNNGNNAVVIQGITVSYFHSKELSKPQIVDPVPAGTRLTTLTTIARFISTVLEPEKDGDGDIATRVFYDEEGRGSGLVNVIKGGAYDVQPVPEPLTIFGTATALGCGVLFKRKSSKKTVS